MVPRTPQHLRRFALHAGLWVALLGTVAVGGGDASGQPIPQPPPLAPINSEGLGVITPLEDPSGLALRQFYRALARTARGEDKTRITVFGASHVAGDGFMRVMRHELKQRYGDAGAGFVVPAKPWRNYYNKDVNLAYSDGWESYWVSKTRNRDDGLYGLAGVTFTSDSKKDWARVETGRGAWGKNVSRATVYYWAHPEGGGLDIYVDGTRKRRVKTATAKGVQAGPGYATVTLADASHTIEVRPRGNGEVILFGIALDRDVPGIVMDHMGINGARAATQLEWDPRVFADHLARRDPDLLVLAYGTNAIGDDDDPIRKYEARLDLVVGRIKALLPTASCLLIGPSDRPVKVDARGDDGKKRLSFLPRPRQRQVIDVQRKIAHRYGCGYWDWAAAMGGDLSMMQWVHSEPRLGARDYVHLTRAGYKRIGRLFMDAVMARTPGSWAAGGQWAPLGATMGSSSNR